MTKVIDRRTRKQVGYIGQVSGEYYFCAGKRRNNNIAFMRPSMRDAYIGLCQAANVDINDTYTQTVK